MNVVPLPGRLHQAVPGFEDHLIAELNGAGAFLTDGIPLYHEPGQPAAAAFWHQNCWLEPFRLEFSSINEAAGALRAIQRNWAACLFTLFRRSALIASKLPPISSKPRPFLWRPGDSPVGAWTLLDEHTLIASARCSSPFPNGAIEFAEDREGPPSRAYLKLWEAFARLRRWPSSGERCLDAGASPGGWTWTLARLGAKVLAADRAPLEDRVAALPNVEFIRHDAFTLNPRDIGPIDWLFCDAACYPPRLYGWIEKWLASGLCRNFVCTIKMQGNVADNGVDFLTPRRFAEIPGGEVVHLYHNKHELTWLRVMQN
jgi:23S rRNA (cytidine2498-2'-O)-methyltransferase